MDTADELEMVDLLQNDVAQVCRGVTGGHQDVHILGWTLEFVFGGQMCGHLAGVASGLLQ